MYQRIDVDAERQLASVSGVGTYRLLAHAHTHTGWYVQCGVYGKEEQKDGGVREKNGQSPKRVTSL